MIITLEKMDAVAERWPVEVPCYHSSTGDMVWCKLCKDDGQFSDIDNPATGSRPATGADLMFKGSDGWPLAPMRAWWERYGGELRMNDTGGNHVADAGCGAHGAPVVAKAMQAAAVAMLGVDNE